MLFVYFISDKRLDQSTRYVMTGIIAAIAAAAVCITSTLISGFVPFLIVTGLLTWIFGKSRVIRTKSTDIDYDIADMQTDSNAIEAKQLDPEYSDWFDDNDDAIDVTARVVSKGYLK